MGYCDDGIPVNMRLFFSLYEWALPWLCQFFHLSYSIGTENGQNAMEEMFRFAYKIKPHA